MECLKRKILEIYFVASFISLLKLNLWIWDATGNLQVDIMTGIVLDILYISVYYLLF